VKRIFSVLFVCSGNTCRSPLAERILKHHLKKRRRKGINVSSAGTGALDGLPASEGARNVAREIGVSMAGFKSKRLTWRRVARADLILTMTPYHRDDVGMKWPDAAGKTHMLSEYTGSERGPITDPVGGSHAVYARCAADLSDEIQRLLPKLERAAANRTKRKRAGAEK
jgi:protein-tyrosine phosphatase